MNFKAGDKVVRTTAPFQKGEVVKYSKNNPQVVFVEWEDGEIISIDEAWLVLQQDTSKLEEESQKDFEKRMYIISDSISDKIDEAARLLGEASDIAYNYGVNLRSGGRYVEHGHEYNFKFYTDSLKYAIDGGGWDSSSFLDNKERKIK